MARTHQFEHVRPELLELARADTGNAEHQIEARAQFESVERARHRAAGSAPKRERDPRARGDVGQRHRLRDQRGGGLRIGAPDAFGSFFLAPRLGGLADRHPDLQLELVATARLFSLSKREADIAISLTMPQEGRIIGRRLVDYRLFLYASQDFLARTGPVEKREDLMGRRVIGYISELLFTPELDYLPKVLPGLSAQIRSANLIAQLQATLAGVGLAVLPRFLAKNFPALVPVLPEEISILRSFYLLMHADGKEFPQVRAVADYLYTLAEREKSLFLDPP